MAQPIHLLSPARKLRGFLLLFAAIATAVLACYDSVPTAPGLHIHPFEAFTPATCLDSANNIVTLQAEPGFSDADSAAMYQNNKYITDSLSATGWAPVPEYVMDPRWIYRQPPDQPFINFANDMSKALNWTAGGRCKWVRPTPSQVPAMLVVQPPISFSKQLPGISP